MNYFGPREAPQLHKVDNRKSPVTFDICSGGSHTQHLLKNKLPCTIYISATVWRPRRRAANDVTSLFGYAELLIIYVFRIASKRHSFK
jgi:hypothetical protein